MYQDNLEPPKLRYSLRTLLVLLTGASVLCLLLFVVAPQVWELATELLAVRQLKKGLMAGLGLGAVFVAILLLGVLFRYATLFFASVFGPLSGQSLNDRAEKSE